MSYGITKKAVEKLISAISVTWATLSGRPNSSVENIDEAVTKKHTQNTDQALDTGGGNEISAANAKAAYTHSGVVTGNPHSVTKSDVGLSDVDNKSEATIITDAKADSDVADAISKKHNHSFIVAASDSSAQDKAIAGYICDGTNDQIEIQAAIDALPVSGGNIKLTKGTFNLSGTINLIDNMILEGEKGTKILAKNGGTYTNGLMYLIGKTYIEIKNLYITCENSVNAIAIKAINLCEHIDISNLYFNEWLGDECIYAENTNFLSIIHCTSIAKCMFAKIIAINSEAFPDSVQSYRNRIMDCSIYFYPWGSAVYDVNTIWIEGQDEFLLANNWIVPSNTTYSGVYFKENIYTIITDNFFATPLITTNLLYIEGDRWANVVNNNFQFGKIHFYSSSDSRGYFANNVLCYGATEEHNAYTDVILYADTVDTITKKHTQNTDTALRTDKLIVDETGKVTISPTGGYGANFLTGGVASASGEYAGGGWEAAQAFNGNWSLPGWSSDYTAFPHWLKYDSGEGITKIARKIKIKTYWDETCRAFLKTVQIQGSNNGSDWTIIETIVLADNGDAQEFEFANDTGYRYHRWYCVDTWSPDRLNAHIIEVEMYEADSPEDKLRVNGHTDIVGEISEMVYRQNSEPTLTADNRISIWIDTDDANKVYLIFRRGTGDQVAVELV